MIVLPVVVVLLLVVLIKKWLTYLRTLPPGPILPLSVLRHLCWWSKFYGKSDLDIILGLGNEYSGTFCVNIGLERVAIMSDMKEVQVKSIFI